MTRLIPTQASTDNMKMCLRRSEFNTLSLQVLSAFTRP